MLHTYTELVQNSRAIVNLKLTQRTVAMCNCVGSNQSNNLLVITFQLLFENIRPWVVMLTISLDHTKYGRALDWFIVHNYVVSICV